MTAHPEDPPIPLRTAPSHGSGEAAPALRRLRSDARHNRRSLLAVAVSTLSRSDSEVSLEAIAREAGVGIGTLYRHFPTREALVVEAYADELDHLCTAVDGLLGSLPPEVALREWMQWFVDYVATKRGMPGALAAAVDATGGPLADIREQVLAALARLLEAGQAAEVFGADVDAEDLLCALRGIWILPDSGPRPERARRLLNLLVDGVEAGAPRPARRRPGAGHRAADGRWPGPVRDGRG